MSTHLTCSSCGEPCSEDTTAPITVSGWYDTDSGHVRVALGAGAVARTVEARCSSCDLPTDEDVDARLAREASEIDAWRAAAQ